jgi:hypothetical protein
MAIITINFTKKALESIKPPLNGRAYWRDEKEKNLLAAVTPNGTISFYMRKRVRGRDERIMLGRYPEMTIEQARKAGLTNAATLFLH